MIAERILALSLLAFALGHVIGWAGGRAHERDRARTRRSRVTHALRDNDTP